MYVAVYICSIYIHYRKYSIFQILCTSIAGLAFNCWLKLSRCTVYSGLTVYNVFTDQSTVFPCNPKATVYTYSKYRQKGPKLNSNPVALKYSLLCTVFTPCTVIIFAVSQNRLYMFAVQQKIKCFIFWAEVSLTEGSVKWCTVV